MRSAIAIKSAKMQNLEENTPKEIKKSEMNNGTTHQHAGELIHEVP